MNLLDRLLGHDLATTEALLRLCSELLAELMDTPVDAGWGTLRKTFAHMIGNIEVWTDLMMERPVRNISGDLHSMWQYGILRRTRANGNRCFWYSRRCRYCRAAILDLSWVCTG